MAPEGNAARRLTGIRLGPARLRVADLARSLDWYDRVLGLRPGEDGATLLTRGGEPVVSLVERPGARPHGRRGRLGLFHYAILLPDRAALGRFLAHARSLGVPFGASDHLVSEALYLSDPDGLGVEVYADRAPEEWPREDGRLEMATLPLDADSLLRAGQGEAWSGMPAGARIGHLHLHVGDLDRAEAFYAGAVGLEPSVRGYPGALFLAADGYHHHLGLNTWAGPGAEPAGALDAGLDLWEIIVPGERALALAADRLRAAGVTVALDAPAGVVGTGVEASSGSRSGAQAAPGPGPAFPAALIVADPWGTRLRLLV